MRSMQSDISRQALTKAARAIYSEKSFRGEGTAHARQLYKDWYRPTGRRSHFRQVDGGYELCEEVRRTVTFMHGNLLDAWFLVDKKYEVIFCRNLSIYFDAAARDRTLRVLERLLEDAGLLFVGSAETGQMNKEYFTAVQHPFAFAYYKTHQPVQPLLFPPRTRERAGQRPAETVEVAKLSHPLMLNQKREARNENPRAQNSGLRTPPSTSPEDLLKQARRFADRGHLEEAAALCKTYLQTHPTSAYAYGLLGEVAQELGHIEQAEQYFQRAIYLNPHYWEALTHLALLREHRGDLASAVLLRQRVQRVRGS
ncbi:MAG: tetratricopeptide repeat protein [Coleofasciculaceae cyanobacterium SM2_3_26]|nr:tetratricopeptide repeat protein [Coleofasciculaceae cyanobacterium SM2_3_26]